MTQHKKYSWVQTLLAVASCSACTSYTSEQWSERLLGDRTEVLVASSGVRLLPSLWPFAYFDMSNWRVGVTPSWLGGVLWAASHFKRSWKLFRVFLYFRSW